MTARSHFDLPYQPQRKLCGECHRVYYSWGAHAEECVGNRTLNVPSGPVSEVCDCGPGWHELGCPVVVAPARKAGT